MNVKKIDHETMYRILGLLRPYAVLIVLSLLLAIATVMTTLYVPVLTGQAVDTIIGPDRVDFAALSRIGGLITIMLTATAISQWCLTAVDNRIVFAVVRDMRANAFEHLQGMPLAYLDSHHHGDIESCVITDIDQFSEGLLMGFSQLFTGVMTIVTTLVFMFRLSPVIALVVVAVTPLSIIAAGFIAKKSYTFFKQQSARRGAMTAIVQEMIAGQDTVRVFGMEDAVCQRFAQADEQLRQASFKATFYSSITNPTTRFVNAVVYAGVGIGGALAAIGGTISIGQLTSFLSYATQYTKPFNEISGVITEMQNSVACAQRYFSLLDQPLESPDIHDAAVLKDVKGQVELQGVSFSYLPDKPLFDGLSLTAAPGQRIAIVGPTGCGKTTLINLLMRFYDVTQGRIAVDGCDIRKLTRNSLRAGYGMVLQDTWIHSGTVAANIAFGRPDASREQIVQAARQAYADEFITRLPQGYDTVLGQDGGGLSAGQRQLLCIARVMLTVPPMLILDEATSSIDTRTELCIQKAFDRLMEGRTSFVVAHRLSTIVHADLILVMKDGRIIEQGRHEQLLAAGGFYAKLYNSQFEQV